MKLKTKLKQISFSWYFLLIILFVYLLIFIFQKQVFFESFSFFNKIILNVIPVFLFVFLLMVLTNYFITPSWITKHLKGNPIKKWLYAIIGGTLSTGPIYMWYPLLADLKKKGLNDGLIACFLYNRGIKLPLLPIAVFYFGWKFVIVLSLTMILLSVVQGMIINKFLPFKK